MMNSVNETNNEINAHVSKLEISGDEAIEDESNRGFSNRKKFMHDSDFKNSSRKQMPDSSNRKN
jgi:hypothetical protein